MKATLIPSGARTLTDPAVRGIERGERDARDRGRQRERQIDQRVDDPLGRKGVAHQHPGDQQSEHGVDQGGGEGGAEAQPVRGQRAR